MFDWLCLVLAFVGSAAEVNQRFNDPGQEEATLVVYAEKQADIDLVLKTFDELVKDKFTRKEVMDDLIMSLELEEVIALIKINCLIFLILTPVKGSSPIRSNVHLKNLEYWLFFRYYVTL